MLKNGLEGEIHAGEQSALLYASLRIQIQIVFFELTPFISPLLMRDGVGSAFS